MLTKRDTVDATHTKHIVVLDIQKLSKNMTSSSLRSGKPKIFAALTCF